MAASSRIICLNLGMQTVGMAEFHAAPNGGLTLEGFRLTELLPDPGAESTRAAQIQIALGEMKEALKIKGGQASYAIPAQAVFTRFVKLPTVGEEKVEQIIQFEAQQNVPFPIDEVVWDYQLVSAQDSSQMEVVLVAIKSEMVDELNRAIEASGFRTSTVDVAPMALYNAFRYNYSDVPGCSLLIDVGARTTNLIFIESGKVFSRSIPIGGTSVTQAIAKDFEEPFGASEERKRKHGLVSLGGSYAEHEDPDVARLSKVIRNSMTRLHADIARSISFYRSQQQGSQPLRAYLCGGAVSLPYAREFFAEKLNLPIEFFNSLRNVSIGAGVNADDAGRSAHVMGELVGLGLRAVSDCPMELNLEPESVVRAQALSKRIPYFVASGVCLLLLLTGFWLYYLHAATVLRAANQKMDLEIQPLARIEAEFKRIADERREAVNLAAPLVQAVDDRGYWVQLLEDFNSRLPEMNIWVTTLEPGYFTDKFLPIQLSGKDGARGYLPEGIETAVAAPAQPRKPARPDQQSQSNVPVMGLRLHGLYLENPRRTAVIDDFAKALEQSPFVSSVEVVLRAQDSTEAWAYDFELTVKLKKAISIP